MGLTHRDKKVDTLLGFGTMPIVSVIVAAILNLVTNTNIYSVTGDILIMIAWFVSLIVFFLAILENDIDNEGEDEGIS